MSDKDDKLPINEAALKVYQEIGRIMADPMIFLCGPSGCQHDYSEYVAVYGGGSAVCSKCGARAFDEAAWL